MSVVRQVEELLGQGLSRPQIASRLKITYHAVRLACDALGIPRRGCGGRPPRDSSNVLTNLLDQCRQYATKAGLFFRTVRGTHYFYDAPIATFSDVHAALAFVKNQTRREASRQLRRMNGHALAVPHSLGSAATYETSTSAGSGGGVAAAPADVVVSGVAAFCVVLNQPRLAGCCARLGVMTGQFSSK